MVKKTFVTAAMTAMAFASSSSALAAGAHEGGHHGASIGKPGKERSVDRTVQIRMMDNYYEPKSLKIEQGETIRFKVRNAGSLVHEFNIGTPSMHKAHRGEMMSMVQNGIIEGGTLHRDRMGMEGHGMKHDDPNSVLLEPGQSREMIWHFSKDTNLQFACNVPGHYQSGMHGSINVQ
ncbi:putative cupredoxin-like copper-binding protein [Tamilnaduibacter salinus]|uniref:Putative cupredoxin-like copper-binding protein n=1 Tax=Tamilnaduibacter salinus TaxID=1484056 RepID=A0A2U1CZQ7_9GAMM|nr:cupredoxin domain-containing protein [Tamilnaduibacter salinus]PVY78144.1 putative cupredoxin-like copper-binding protein [Tamilnaduibacter salinus]